MIAMTTRSSIRVKPAAIVLLARAVFVLMLWARTMVKSDQLGPCSLFYHAEKAAARMMPPGGHPGDFRPTSSRTAFLT